MRLSNFCPHCRRYLFQYGDGENKPRYTPVAAYKELWKRIYGKYYLKDFYKTICPVCKKRLAVFEDITNENFRMKGPIVVYSCTLTDKPYDEQKCKDLAGCVECGILKQQREDKTVLWYRKRRYQEKSLPTINS